MEKVIIKWTPFALHCLDEIFFYISTESGSTDVANKFIESLFERVDQLSDFPESGSIEIHLKDKGLMCRFLVEGNYKIIYEFNKNQPIVVILDVFHTSQNPEKIIVK